MSFDDPLRELSGEVYSTEVDRIVPFGMVVWRSFKERGARQLYPFINCMLCDHETYLSAEDYGRLICVRCRWCGRQLVIVTVP